MKPLRFCLTLLTIALCCLDSYAQEILLLQKMQEALKAQKSFALPLHEERNKEGVLTHLGVALFAPDYQQAIDPHLWRGAERMLLEIALQPDDNQRRIWLKERNTSLWREGAAFGKGSFTRFESALPILKQVKTLKLNEEPDRYRLILYGGPDSTLLRLSFPKERELIFGTDKKEEDEILAEYLSHYSAPLLPKPALPAREELLPTDLAQIWHTAGEALFIDSLRTDGYYTWSNADPVVRVLDSAQYPRESLTNLMLGLLKHSELTVSITHRQYGNSVKEWDTTWETLHSALCNNERTKAYAAVHYRKGQENLTGVLVLQNTAFNYTHMLLLSVPEVVIGSHEPTTVSAMLFTNIPQHNVISLFEERQRPANASANRPTEVYNHSINKQ